MEEITSDFAQDLGAFLATGALWPWEEAEALLRDATGILARESTLERVELPAGGHLNVVGDVHGQFFDLLSIWRANGSPSEENPYLFNGDFVDRGSYSVEIMLVLLAWKVAYPSHVRLARGNHEGHDMNVPYGFAGEVLTKYGRQAYMPFQQVFARLPLAHVVNGDAFIVHGGLPRESSVGLAEIEALDRVALGEGQGQGEPSMLLTDLLWADPSPAPGSRRSQRGANVMVFGPDVTQRFLAKNDLSLLIRSHEVKDEGYEWTHGGQCLTVFSAPEYCDSCDNRGAVIRLTAPAGGGPLEHEVRCFDAAPKPPFYVPAMVYSPMNPACRQFLSDEAKEVLGHFIQSQR